MHSCTCSTTITSNPKGWLSMKALVVTACDTLEVLERPVPQPGENEAVVRVHYTGICGSDVPRVLEGRVHGFPIVLGHEFSGIVEAVGSAKDEHLIGKRVAGVPLVPCMECEDCALGHYSQCTHYRFIGSRIDGSMAEYVCVPTANLFIVSDNISDLEAAFFEPATVGMHALRLARFEAGTSVAVIGAGTIGLLLAQELVALDASKVVVINRSAHRLETAQLLSGLTTLCSAEDSWQQNAKELSGGRGFDMVFDTVANSQTIADSCAIAAACGTVCFVGTPKQDISLTISQWEQINRKELHVTGSWMSYSAPWPGSEWTDVARLFAQNRLIINPQMIDRIYPLAEGRAAFDRFKSPSQITGKILIDSSEVS